MVALAGLVVLGIAWEMGAPTVGWILAATIWIVGDPLLEIAGAMGSKDRNK